MRKWSLLVLLTVIATMGHAGSIVASLTQGSFSNLNLTTQGTIDWAVWGQGSSISLSPTDDKSGGTAISDLTLVGADNLRGLGVFGTYGETTFQWTNGTNSPSASNVDAGLQHNGTVATPEGFSFTVTAATTPEELIVYDTLNYGVATLSATLSDGGSILQTMNLYNSNVPYYSVIDFEANSTGQTLTVTLELTADTSGNDSGNAALTGVSLSSNQSMDFSSVPEPATLTLFATSLVGLIARRFKR